MISRKLYHDQIKPFIDKPVIKAITGIRRSGKSTFIKQIIENLKKSGVSEKQIVYVNMELMEFDSIKDYKSLYDYIQSQKSNSNKKSYLFIDEVQEVLHWEKAVNSLLAEGNHDVYITGSNAQMMSSELTSLLSGRYVEIKLYTFTFSEFSELFKKTNPTADEDSIFNKYMKFGGFPGLHNLNWDDEVIRQFLESIYNTIVLKDLVMRHQIRDASMLHQILSYIADNCGNITAAKNISDFVKSQNRKVSVDTVLNYIQHAMDALLIHKVKRYNIQGKKLLETYDKYFMSDIGLRYATRGYSPEMISGQLENIVLHELFSRGYQVFVGSNQQKEVDFIAKKGNDITYYQVTTTLKDPKTVDREYGAFDGIDDFFPKLVISTDQGFDTNYKGIQWRNIREFLLDK